MEKPCKYAALAAEIIKIIGEDECNDTYGSMRMHHALTLKKEIAESKGEDFPEVPSERTIYRIMHKMGMIHKPKRNPKGLTKADKEAQKSDNLIKNNEIIDGQKQSDFIAEKPCEKCVADITEVACSNGKLYISAVEDVHLHPLLRVNMAIVYSDRGSQYTSDLYKNYIAQTGLRQSMNSAAGRCHDNAKCESLWARMKSELFYGRYDTTKMTIEQVKTLVWRYFMGYWNNQRICSVNGGLPPVMKRERYYAACEAPRDAA